ncbi:MAG: cyanophycin synthetase, partial [Opitutaceae bacterium]
VSGVSFTLLWRGQHWANIAWAQPGIFNARNAAMAATASALAVHPEDPTKLALDALASFRGVKRRQEVLLNTPLLTVIEDFGHHPTALAETLRSFRARYLGARLTAVFEPRSNTARTKAMQAGFEEALALADDVYLGAVNRPEKLKAEERFDPQHVVQNLQVHGLHAQTAASNAELLELLKRETLPLGPRRIVAFFSNGSFDGIVQKYVAAASL